MAPSSTELSQSSSISLQTSAAPGWMSGSMSSQSLLSVTVPEGAEQASLLLAASP